MIIFRVDANEEIATGHLMRCITIATELVKHNIDVLFCLAENKFTERLETMQINYIVMNTVWNDMSSELPVFEKIINKYKPEWIIVDSYYINAIYLEELNTKANVLYYDDLAKQKYNIAAVIHPYDFGLSEYKKIYDNTKIETLLGLQYLPIRNEFYPKTNHEKTKHIFLTTGGTDKYNISGKVVDAINKVSDFKEYILDIVIGKMNEHIDEIKNAVEKSEIRVNLYYDINNMGEMMRQSDYAITAGGTTVYEICACQIPSVCFSIADNQKEFIEDLGKFNIMVSVGDVRNDVNEAVERIVQGLTKLMYNNDIENMLIENMSRLIDGKGVTRIYEFLKKKEKTDNIIVD